MSILDVCGRGRALARGVAATALAAFVASSPLNVAAQSAEGPRYRVIGGGPTDVSRWPGVAALRLRLDNGAAVYICGATAINSRWVLTAAHCFHGFLGQNPTFDVSRLEIVFEAGDLTEVSPSATGPGVFSASRVVIPDSYVAAVAQRLQAGGDLGSLPLTADDDIALIQLSAPYSAAQYMPLSASSQSDPAPRSMVVVGGYGRVETERFDLAVEAGGFSIATAADATRYIDVNRTGSGRPVFAQTDRLLSASFEVVSNELCAASTGGTIGPNDLCGGLQTAAGDALVQGERAACSGDSGGPLVVPGDQGPVQVGVVSWGPRQESCGTQATPVVYTRVSAYIEWIRGVVGDALDVRAARDASARITEQERRAFLDELRAISDADRAAGASGFALDAAFDAEQPMLLDQRVRFTLRSRGASGILVMIDAQPTGEVDLVIPNEGLRIAQAPRISPRDPLTLRLCVSEPTGRGQIIAVVAPETTDLSWLPAFDGARFRGDAGAGRAGAMMRFIRALQRARDPSLGGEASGWGAAIVDYEISSSRAQGAGACG